MSRGTTVVALRQPDAIDDPLIAEAVAFVALWKDEKLPSPRRLINLVTQNHPA
jgi:hypothetical protein